jgi:hypothetical protein
MVTYLSASLAPIVAGLGVLIAWRQWRTAQNKLKLDLFERRLAIYHAATRVVGTVQTSGKVQNEELSSLMSSTREAKWLLNAHVAEFLEKDLYHKLLELQTLDMMLDGLPVGAERAANVQAQRVLKDWVGQQYDVLDAKFAPFLVLRH